MPEYTYAKGRIPESAQFISNEMKEFKNEYANISWEEYQRDGRKQKLVDRTVENILNALIEICGAVLAEEGKSADNYAETLRLAAEFFGFDPKVSSELAKLAHHRNRLVHRYLNMKWQTIGAYKAQVKNIEKLLMTILDRVSGD